MANNECGDLVQHGYDGKDVGVDKGHAREHLRDGVSLTTGDVDEEIEPSTAVAGVAAMVMAARGNFNSQAKRRWELERNGRGAKEGDALW